MEPVPIWAWVAIGYIMVSMQAAWFWDRRRDMRHYGR